MTTPDTRPAFGDDPSFKPYNEPLLGQRSNHARFNDDDNDIERVDDILAESFSRQSSFGLTDPSFEQIPLNPSSSWTTKLQRYVSSLARPIQGRRDKSGPATRARSKSLRVGLYAIAITLMMLSVTPPPLPSSPSHTHLLTMFSQRHSTTHLILISYISYHIS